LVGESNFIVKEGSCSFKKHEDKLHKACCGASTIMIKCALINVLVRFPKSNFINLMKTVDEITLMYQFLPDLRKFLNNNNLPYFQFVKSISKIKRNQTIFKSYVLEGENIFNTSQFTNKMPSTWNHEDFYQFSKLSLFMANIRMNIPLITHKTLRTIFSQKIMDFNEKQLLDLSQNLKISFIQIWTIINDINILYCIKTYPLQSNINVTNINNNNASINERKNGISNCNMSLDNFKEDKHEMETEDSKNAVNFDNNENYINDRNNIINDGNNINNDGNNINNDGSNINNDSSNINNDGSNINNDCNNINNDGNNINNDGNNINNAAYSKGEKTFYGTNYVDSETSDDVINSSSECSDDSNAIILDDIKKKRKQKIKIDGRAIEDLRVVDLKSELKKRNLKPFARSKKIDLIAQLRTAIISEKNRK